MATPTIQLCFITLVLIVAVDAIDNEDTIKKLSAKETSGDGKPIITENSKENAYLQENPQINVNREDKVRLRVKGEEESIVTSESGKERTLSNEKAKQTKSAKISVQMEGKSLPPDTVISVQVESEIRTTPVMTEEKSTTTAIPSIAPTKTETPISSTTMLHVSAPLENQRVESSRISSAPTPLESSAPMPVPSPNSSPELSPAPTVLKSTTPLPSFSQIPPTTPLTSPEELYTPIPITSPEESSSPMSLTSHEVSSTPTPSTSPEPSSTPTPLQSPAPKPNSSPTPTPSSPTPLQSPTLTPLTYPDPSSTPTPLISSAPKPNSTPTPIPSSPTPLQSPTPTPSTSFDEPSAPTPLKSPAPKPNSSPTPIPPSPTPLQSPTPTPSTSFDGESSAPTPLKSPAPKPNSTPTPIPSSPTPLQSPTPTPSTSVGESSAPTPLKSPAPKPNSTPTPIPSSPTPLQLLTPTPSTSFEPSSAPTPLKSPAPKPNSTPTPIPSSPKPLPSPTPTPSTPFDGESSAPTPLKSPAPKPNSTPTPIASSPTPLQSPTLTPSTSFDEYSAPTPLKSPAPKPNSTPTPTASSPARILALIPYNARSHFAMFEALFRALAARGHHVDVLSHFAPEQTPPNYRTLSVRGAAESWEDGLHVEDAQALGALAGALDIWTDTLRVCEKVWEHPTTQKLLSSRESYDLVISEIFGAECMMGFAHKLQAPLVGVVSSVAPPGALDRMDNPENPAYVANYFLPYTARMTLWQRLTNTLHQLALRRLRPLLCDRPSDALQRRYLGEGLPASEELRRNTSLVLVNSHFSANQARPLVPGVVEVGGLHVSEARPLPSELQRWVESSPHGVVVFSLGTMVRVSTWAPERLHALWQALGSLPQRVLLKSKDTLPAAPRNVRVEAWLPQRDLLAHRNVVGLVTHGGLMGLQEALWEGVPMLGIPMFADQRFNLVTMADKGVALLLEYHDITSHSLTTALQTLVTDPDLRSRAATLSKQFRDRPLSARATAVWWVEYVLRHRGAPHLRSPPAQDYHHDHNDLLLLLGVVALTTVAIVGALVCLRRGGRERIRRRKEKIT